ncbi:hypothetical protein D9613_011984 [Agrocybe pediades]|uniref:Uncharacterized protein n=1 Tax=Agrocybe pediades TaxID=84607 RepID=A0A8H4QEP7_9AGAR|nr:hypothetical protein D9613_011984 [Agrocybe pediades]
MLDCTFVVDESAASVQSTLYKMPQRVITENANVNNVSYALPDERDIPVDMRYLNIDNHTLPLLRGSSRCHFYSEINYFISISPNAHGKNQPYSGIGPSQIPAAFKPYTFPALEKFAVDEPEGGIISDLKWWSPRNRMALEMK